MTNNYDINSYLADEVAKADTGRGSSFFQKIFNDEAPPISYISSRGECNIILLPVHSSYGSAPTMTSGGFRSDKDRGIYPTLSSYGLDWMFVYKDVGNSPDRKKRKTILSINMMEDKILPEQEWGNVYKSPMFRLRDYLWRLGGEHVYDSTQRRTIARKQVDLNNWQVKRALELVPPTPTMNDPMPRPVRTLFLQGLVVSNAGTDYTTDEDGNSQWPQHRILMISQISAIKSKAVARAKEGFYDNFFAPRDPANITNVLDTKYVLGKYGDIRDNVQNRAKWEQESFLHSDFATNLKVLTFKSYPAQSGLPSYECLVSNMAGMYGADFQIPDDVARQIRPINNYLQENNEAKQKEWLAEVFPGDEWALIGAGVMDAPPTSVAVPAGITAVTPIPTMTAPTVNIPIPTMTAPAVITPAANTAPGIAPNTVAAPAAPTSLRDRLKNLQNKTA